MRTDFIEIAAFHNLFMSEFNATKYIEDNPHLHFLNPQQFVAEYQDNIDAYLQNQSLRCQRLLIEKKYVPFILLNKTRFYDIYEDKYMQLFHSLDIAFAKESKIIQAKVIEAIQEISNQETH